MLPLRAVYGRWASGCIPVAKPAPQIKSKIMQNLLVTFVALAAAFITFLIARHIFQHQLKLGPPTLLALATAGLAFLGLSAKGGGLVAFVLLPFQVLALALPLAGLILIPFWVVRWLSRQGPKGGTSACGILRRRSSGARVPRQTPVPPGKPHGLREPIKPRSDPFRSSPQR
jgi:hypothetical protein